MTKLTENKFSNINSETGFKHIGHETWYPLDPGL